MLQRFFRRFVCTDCKRLFRLESGRVGFTCPKCQTETSMIGSPGMAKRWAYFWAKGYVAYLKGRDGKLVKIGRPIGFVMNKKKKT